VLSPRLYRTFLKNRHTSVSVSVCSVEDPACAPCWVFCLEPPPVLAPANIAPTISRHMAFCGQYTYGRSRARPMAARQIPQISLKSPYSVGTLSREKFWQVWPPSLHPKWSRSRVSLGEPGKGTHRASQNLQHSVILGSYNYFRGALLVQLPGKKCLVQRGRQVVSA
jgi:hypothetical protein